MAITLVRVDDRIIHGQVLTQWTRIYKCDGIIVVNDNLSENKSLGNVYKNAAPENIKVHIFSVEKTIRKLPEAIKSQKNYFLISKTPLELKTLLENNISFGNYIVYGPSSYRDNTTTIGANQSLTKDEMDACEFFFKNNIDIDFKLIPNKKGFKWSEIREKYY
ncbi:PTS sugar transporter subunit IIB [Oceanotoga sp. DSM 15011]|jgi:PTS system mannose-specific IIB component|uniref:PTS system mannose-specific IIB component n=1 Tax=Oceanotoga teriensis TaxID=515440 RepID=A0AA45HHX5_9BACT|nr:MULTISPECIES: PTS sugar transporter subunit IIB [Oceanotoga]PWJ89009.1 PTS system mannose-specific IIB component [Oceanotoga teriensis]UYP01373.1 PTS sugar transporter subunit IIB [Oceanotoga sp. DSM 15011]